MKIVMRISFAILILLVGLAAFVRPAAAAGCFYYSLDVDYVCDSDPAPSIFVEPQAFPDSLLERATYARLKDLVNVYPEPTTAVAPVRNVGDGFLFVTVQAVEVHDGVVWYMINLGEWVKEEDLILVDGSSFTGLEVHAQPERSFGWMIADFWYSNEPAAEPVSGAVKLPRYTFFEVYNAVEGDDGWIWYDIGNGRWMRQTYVSLVDVNPRPEGVGEDEFWVEVDLYEQAFAAYEGDLMVYAGLISSGLNRWPTYEGLYQVWDRQDTTKMSGAEGKVDYYFIEDVPHTMFFDQDIALHGAFWHDRFGYKHSHGCVNMPPRAAEWVYNWSTGSSANLWVWVHTSEPDEIFRHYDPQVNFAGP